MGPNAFFGAVRAGAARLLLRVVRLHENRGDYTKARGLCELAVRILDNGPRTRGRERLRVFSLNRLGTLDLVEARYDQAEARFREGLAIATAVFGPRHLETSILLNNLAVVHKYQGRFLEAKRLYLRALAITGAALGLHHASVATIYHNLGGLEHARGRF